MLGAKLTPDLSHPLHAPKAAHDEPMADAPGLSSPIATTSPMVQTPTWFIADSQCNTIESKRAEATRESHLQELCNIFPNADPAMLARELAAGGDLSAVANRVLSGEAASASAAKGKSTRHEMMSGVDELGLCATMGSTSCEDTHAAGSSRDHASHRAEAPHSITTPTTGYKATGTSSASSAVSSKFGPSIAKFGAQCDDLLKQTVAQLAAGALAISARVVSTRNEMEGTMLSEKIVTKYVLEVSQLGFKWEVARRYSEFAAFNEALSATWMMPELPPKILFNQERIQILRDARTRG